MKKTYVYQGKLSDSSLRDQIDRVSIQVQKLCVANHEVKVYFNYKIKQIFTCFNMEYKYSHLVCTFKSMSKIPLEYIVEEITNYYNLQYDSWENYHNKLESELS